MALRIASALFLAFFIVAIGSARPESSGAEGIFEEPVCAPPIQVCGPPPHLQFGPVPIPQCPPGHECVCVPSCPACADCAAEVCVPVQPRCETACDCPTGLACFSGQCIAGIVPVFCCDSAECPQGAQCQHRDGRPGVCEPPCNVPEVWLCGDEAGVGGRCGTWRSCSCTASCPECEDCGPPVCVPPGTPTPYRCSEDGGCANPGDRCVCAGSCPGCDDCPIEVCVPAVCEDPQCDRRRNIVARRLDNFAARKDECTRHDECVYVNNTTGCGGRCGDFIHRDNALRYEARRSHLDEKFCATYTSDGCPYVVPLCVPERPGCVEGRCVGLPYLPVPRL